MISLIKNNSLHPALQLVTIYMALGIFEDVNNENLKHILSILGAEAIRLSNPNVRENFSGSASALQSEQVHLDAQLVLKVRPEIQKMPKLDRNQERSPVASDQ